MWGGERKDQGFGQPFDDRKDVAFASEQGQGLEVFYIPITIVEMTC
jgi:hypothetical protein